MSASIPALDRLDPAEEWRPWWPTDSDAWGPKWAAHLHRRAGFGPTGDDLLEAGRLGYRGTLERLLGGGPDADEVTQGLVDVGRVVAGADSGDQLRGWWLYAMLHAGHPLREKLTLFWHGHFATSLVKVRDTRLMFRQNCLLREHALGRFGDLLRAIGRDGAMLIWLDSDRNVRGKPNENYARELMELFSLGVGHYTESDVREAARVRFTGWRTDGVGFAFDAHLHDDGPKTVLGQTGNWDGGDVVRIVLEQDATVRFLVRKLYHDFVGERSVPPDSLLEPLCESFRKSDYDIASLARTILSSRHFYSDHAFRQKVKSPVEYVLGAVRSIYGPPGGSEGDGRALPQHALVPRVGAMGQQLFAPPNVKGWPGGRSWLNTATMLERANFAGALAMGTLWSASTPTPARTPTTSRVAATADEDPDPPDPPPTLDPARLPAEEGADRPEEIVRVLLDRYLPGGVRPEVRERLVAYVAEGDPVGPSRMRRVREAVHAILTTAEYHLA